MPMGSGTVSPEHTIPQLTFERVIAMGIELSKVPKGIWVRARDPIDPYWTWRFRYRPWTLCMESEVFPTFQEDNDDAAE